LPMHLLIWSLTAVIFLLSACATGQPEKRGSTESRPLSVGKPLMPPLERPPRGDKTDNAEIPPSKEAPAFEMLKGYRPERPGLSLPARPEGVAFDRGKKVQLTIDDMPLGDFIDFFFGKLMGASYVMGPKADRLIKTPVTIHLKRELTLEQAYRLVLDMLGQYNVDVEYKEGTFYFTRVTPTTYAPIDYGRGDVADLDTPTGVIKIIPIYHIMDQIEDLKKVLAPIGAGRGGVVISQTREGNLLIVKGAKTDVQSVVDLIRVLDRPLFSNRQIGMFRLTYWHPEDFILKAIELLVAEGIPASPTITATGLCFVPIPRLRAVICFAPDKGTLQRVLYWKNVLDVPGERETGEDFFIYFPRHARAEELGETLNSILGLVAARPAETEKAAAPSTTAMVREATPKGGQQGEPAKTRSSKKETGTQTAAAAASSIQGILPSAAKGGAEGLSQMASGGLNVSVVVDTTRNALVIYASAQDYKTVLNLLEQIDIMPKQVLIEVTVAEVTLKDDLQYGVEWYLRTSGDITGTLSTLGGLGLPTGGLTYSLISDSGKFRAMLSMLAKETDIRILSTPHVTIRDNESANIKIGQDVPILVSATTSDIQQEGDTQIIQSVQYRATGVMLQVTPTINSDAMVTLEINQEVSEAQTNTFSDLDSPLILDRSIQTKVVSRHGQSILLGGIISDKTSQTINKVPFLGDIPLLGYLFKTKTKGREKSEVIMLVTPHIIDSEEDIDAVRREIISRMHMLDERQTGRFTE
jgi:general secretion pathway protein D